MKVMLKDPIAFKKLLILKGFSQRGLGRSLKISEPYANQIANGARSPGPEIAKRITDLLCVEFDEIFFIQYDDKSNQTSTA